MNFKKDFKSPDGQVINLNEASLIKISKENISFWEKMKKEKGWLKPSLENIAFWNYILNQTGASKTSKKATLLVISNESPLSTQFNKITGDTYNSGDFQDTFTDKKTYQIYTHRETGKIFVVFNRAFYSKLTSKQLIDKIEQIKRKHNFSSVSSNISALNKPVTKGLTTLCAKTVGTTGRRKSDGSVKKGYVAKKGGKVVAVKKKVVAKKK